MIAEAMSIHHCAVYGKRADVSQPTNLSDVAVLGDWTQIFATRFAG